MFLAVTMLSVGGMLWVMALCPLELIAWRFVRLIGIIALALATAVLGGYLGSRATSTVLPAFIGAASTLAAGVASFAIVSLAPMIAAQQSTWIRRIRVLCGLGGCGAFVGGLGWLSTSGLAPAWFSAVGVVVVFGNLLSAFLIGCVSIGWLLGHRYLTDTEMTIDPLVRVARLLLVAVGGRWIFLLVILVVISVSPGWMALPDETASRFLADWFMLSVRVSVGLILPSAFAYMAWQCVKLRSTQSATGILFFSSILIIIGELTSQFLGRSISVPL